MNLVRLLALLLLMMNTAYAGYDQVEIASYRSTNVPVASFINIDADYVVATVTFSSDKSSPEQRATDLKTFADSLSVLAADHGMELQQQVISISPTEKQKSINSSRAHANLFFKLNENNDVFAATRAMYAFIQKIQAPRGVSYSLSNTSLAVSNPESYRPKLLNLIKSDIESMKAVLGSEYKILISGLEKPVVVRQKNERELTLFIDYKLQMTQQ